MTTTTMINGLQTLAPNSRPRSRAGLPSGLVYGNSWIFSPRAGFAYRLGDSTRPLVLRGGFGVFDSQAALRTWDNLTGSGIPYGYPIQYSVNNQALVGVNGIDGLPNYELRSQPQFVAGVNTTNVLIIRPTSASRRAVARCSSTTPSTATRDMQWNFSLSREISSGIIAKATYLGTHGWNLPQNVNFNAAPPDYVWYTVTASQSLPAPTLRREKMPTTLRPTAALPNTRSKAFPTPTASISNWSGAIATARMAVCLYDDRRLHRGPPWSETAAGRAWRRFLPPAGRGPHGFRCERSLPQLPTDSAIPHHQLKWNWVVDLPSGGTTCWPIMRGNS